jgi:hypothetical protein
MGAVHDLLAVCSRGLAQLLHPFLLDAKYELAGGLLQRVRLRGISGLIAVIA